MEREGERMRWRKGALSTLCKAKVRCTVYHGPLSHKSVTPFAQICANVCEGTPLAQTIIASDEFAL